MVYAGIFPESKPEYGNYFNTKIILIADYNHRFTSEIVLAYDHF